MENFWQERKPTPRHRLNPRPLRGRLNANAPLLTSVHGASPRSPTAVLSSPAPENMACVFLRPSSGRDVGTSASWSSSAGMRDFDCGSLPLAKTEWNRAQPIRTTFWLSEHWRQQDPTASFALENGRQRARSWTHFRNTWEKMTCDSYVCVPFFRPLMVACQSHR